MLLTTLLCFVGFSALSLSMSRHYTDAIGGKLAPGRRQWLRVLGWVALLFSLWAGIEAGGWGMGLVQWSASLMISAMALLIALSWRPRLALLLAGMALLISPVAAISQWLA
ncbi:DUF3325 domain-containing protein [Pseudomonas huanghezhanensis]|uniref:DUF3325 domain-containing protein n=1 Tax=Pseudomonas huanghezhanensis TaxID=3002903 RepID=UPI0022860C39|nr:DUF3325 domain-containing protein [Pseudomonas sp. BSw22131]